MRSRRGMGAAMSVALASVMAGGVAPSIATSAALTTVDNGNQVSVKSTTGTKASVERQSKAHRLTSSRMSGYSWLIPTNKESFKQARRKQLAKKSFKKAKKQGRT